MKNIFLIVFIILSNCFYSLKAQLHYNTIWVKYKTTIHTDQNSNDEIFYTELITNREHSIFYDSEAKNSQKNQVYQTFAGLFYKDFKTSLAEHFYRQKNKKIMRTDSIFVPQNFYPSREEIAKELIGLKCRNIIGTIENYNFTGCYSLKLPYKNGPSFLSNFPGLLLEITVNSEDGKSWVKYEAVDLQTANEKQLIEKPAGKWKSVN